MTAARPLHTSPTPSPARQRTAATRTTANPSTTERTARAPKPSRLLKERGILQEAQSHFAQFGFEGASLENIAAAAGLSRHNLLYYFPSKEALYQRVLDDVLNQWLAGMDDLSHSNEPEAALRQYIQAKLRYSREHPDGAKVFTKEVIAGAPRYGKAIAERVGPRLKAEVRTFERWAKEGRIAKVNFTHLMFIIWSVTQAYADQEAQFALLLGKPALTEKDYEKAEALICQLVLSGLGLQTRPST
ncbi:TetR family transcriptional regulator [Acidovorax sp. 62]|uniref:TetR/AcrR family transcriptional regulator n=1 Tax=Acidovorax sp. 62 TaxID=2035203 RepID=UPI000C177F7B|nr:TetR/AcrR family transcriptional regulator [Acidovorax sp. 62]PIF93514.1 TetR family transcriptional regulator [Acidovorax sp. 62]